MQTRAGWRFLQRDDWRQCFLSYILLTLWCIPLFLKSDMYGILDWDWFTSYFYAVRESVIGYGQFPGYNPWMSLGSPLWANPQIGPVSYLTPFVLVLGPVTGLKWGLWFGYLLSFEGGRALGRHLFRTKEAAIIAGLLFALNGALAAHLVMGHFCFAAYPLSAWLILFFLNMHDDPKASLYAGLTAGLMVHIGLHYYVVYIFLFCAMLAAYQTLKTKKWWVTLQFSGLFLLCFFFVASIRLFPILSVMSDFPRSISLPYALNLDILWRMFLIPAVGPAQTWLTLPYQGQLFRVSGCEFYAFAGYITLLLSLFSLRKGIKFFHVGAGLSFLLTLGNTAFWLPSSWLSHIPPFRSMWVFTRWRVLLLACLALCAAHAIDILLQERDEASSLRWWKIAVWLAPLELIVLLMPGWYQHVLTTHFPNVSRTSLKLPQTKHMLSKRRMLYRKGGLPTYYALFRENIGVVGGYEPLFGYGPTRSIRWYTEHPSYKGEYTVDGKRPVQPTYWSPNHIQFSGLPAGHFLLINLNPGKGWQRNGEPIFTKLKSFALRRHFAVKIPASGKIDLRYRPPGLTSGLWVTMLCGLIGLLLWLRQRKQGTEPTPSA